MLSPETVAALAEGSDQLLLEVAADNAPEQMHAFRQEFAELLKDAEIDRLIVLVDDLDRCLPDIAIATLEAIRLFLFVPRAAFVIAVDEGMIEYAVRQRFPDLPVATGLATYARNYLEKLIQVPFRLPSLGYAETLIYVTLLLVLNPCGEESDEFQKMTGLVRVLLRRPWKGPGLDRKAVEKALGGVPVEVERPMELAGRIAPELYDAIARGSANTGAPEHRRNSQRSNPWSRPRLQICRRNRRTGRRRFRRRRSRYPIGRTWNGRSSGPPSIRRSPKTTSGHMFSLPGTGEACSARRRRWASSTSSSRSYRAHRRR